MAFSTTLKGKNEDLVNAFQLKGLKASVFVLVDSVIFLQD